MPDEFIFGDYHHARKFAKIQGWQEAGRVAWQKQDGTAVHFIKFAEQLEAVMHGERVYFTGKPTAKMIVNLHDRGVEIVRVDQIS